jgi:hypothetical protein
MAIINTHNEIEEMKHSQRMYLIYSVNIRTLDITAVHLCVSRNLCSQGVYLLPKTKLAHVKEGVSEEFLP